MNSLHTTVVLRTYTTQKHVVNDYYVRGVCRISQGGGAQLKNFWDFGYTCREATCREQRSCEPLLGGFGGMPPQDNFFKWCNFVGFEGYFQPLSW